MSRWLQSLIDSVAPNRTQSTHAALLARYKQLRAISTRFGNQLAGQLPKHAIDEGGKRLGILRGKTLFLDADAVLCALMDFCIHDVRQEGRNIIDQMLAHSPPAPESDDLAVLRGMQAAYYSLFVVDAVEPGVGIRLRDLLRGNSIFVVDMGFGSSAEVGLVLASRVMTVEDITMTTGAALPFGMLPPDNVSRFVGEFKTILGQEDFSHVTPEQWTELATKVIRAALQVGAAERVRYEDVPGARSAGPALPARPDRVGRNDPCPCGSGRKFKKCCGKPR